jgi:hypothetical protein
MESMDWLVIALCLLYILNLSNPLFYQYHKRLSYNLTSLLFSPQKQNHTPIFLNAIIAISPTTTPACAAAFSLNNYKIQVFSENHTLT